MVEFETRTNQWYTARYENRERITKCAEIIEAKFRHKMISIERTQLVEQDAELFDPKELLRRDMLAVDLLRGSGVFRHVHRRGERRGAPYLQRTKKSDDTPALKQHELDLVETHSHLFRKVSARPR